MPGCVSPCAKSGWLKVTTQSWEIMRSRILAGIAVEDLCRDPWFRGHLEVPFGTILVNPAMVNTMVHIVGQSSVHPLPGNNMLATISRSVRHASQSSCDYLHVHAWLDTAVPRCASPCTKSPPLKVATQMCCTVSTMSITLKLCMLLPGQDGTLVAARALLSRQGVAREAVRARLHQDFNVFT